MRSRRVVVASVSAVTLIFAVGAGWSVLAGKNKKDPAKRLYSKRCAGACHRLYKPAEYTRGQWEKILADMSERAKLTDADLETIRSYLIRNAKDREIPGESPG